MPKIRIVYHNGTVEEHEYRTKTGEFSKEPYLCGGITGIGFQFYSETIKMTIIVHPASVAKIEYDEVSSYD